VSCLPRLHNWRISSSDMLTVVESLRDYFSQFGEVIECTVMRDSNTGRSRGFGFLTFKDAKTVNIVMVKEHFLDGKIVSIFPQCREKPSTNIRKDRPEARHSS
jgi:RNA recognition motif-containing protein